MIVEMSEVEDSKAVGSLTWSQKLCVTHPKPRDTHDALVSIFATRVRWARGNHLRDRFPGSKR